MATASCPSCNTECLSDHYGSTLLGTSPCPTIPGLRHDPNCHTYHFTCSCGTRWKQRIPLSCQCGWKQDDYCEVCGPNIRIHNPNATPTNLADISVIQLYAAADPQPKKLPFPFVIKDMPSQIG